MVLGMAWGGDEDAAGPRRRRMPPWESRLGPRRRLGTAHAALPRFHRPLRLLHREQKALFSSPPSASLPPPPAPASPSPLGRLRSDGVGVCLLFALSFGAEIL